MLEIDLIKMLYFDPFLAENFIKCFQRYYSHVATFAKEIFVDHLTESHLMTQDSDPIQDDESLLQKVREL